MLKRKSLRFGLFRMLVVMNCLNSCARVHYDNCPAYPLAGPKVAAELEKLDYASAPNTWEWLARINKLRQELQLCEK